MMSTFRTKYLRLFCLTSLLSALLLTGAGADDTTSAKPGAAPAQSIATMEREAKQAEKEAAAKAAEEAAAADPNAVYQGVARTQFNLRETPEVGAARVNNVAQGARFTMTENTNDMWCKIQVGSWTGYAQKSWLTFEKDPPKTGDSGLSTAGDAVQYLCKVYHRGSALYQQPDKGSVVVQLLKQYDYLYVMEYGDTWCHVQLQSGNAAGYIPTEDLFHFQSMNSFRYGVPGYEQWRMTGWVQVNKDLFVTDGSKYYSGNDLCETDLMCARMEEDGTVELMIRQKLVPIDPADYEYTPFTNWREAKKGDCIGGYTQYYGKRQGAGWYKNRQINIKLAMQHLNGHVVKKGEEFRYLKVIGPVSPALGYRTAAITGGPPSTGGGVCHVSTLAYEAALSLPFLITEREPHTTEGNSYAPREFDATVGDYSDLRFINTLPYDVRMEALICNKSGVITLRFFCDETVDPEILANWEKE